MGRKAIWQVLQMYAGDGVLERAERSLYKMSKARLRVCRKEGRSFDVMKGLRQGCIMLPWLISLFIGKIIDTAGICLIGSRCRMNSTACD